MGSPAGALEEERWPPMNVVLCNCPPAESRAIARRLIREGLAACVNVIGGVSSFYEWEGKLEEESEDTLLIKVARSGLAALGDRIRELHPYSTVEIVVLEVDAEQSDPDYVAWVERCGKADRAG